MIVIVQEFIKELFETCFAHLALSIITKFTLDTGSANLKKEYQQVETTIVQIMFKKFMASSHSHKPLWMFLSIVMIDGASQSVLEFRIFPVLILIETPSAT